MTGIKHLDVLNKKRIEISQIVREQISVLGYRSSFGVDYLRNPITGTVLEEYCISVKIVPKTNSPYPVPQDVQTKIEEIIKREAKEIKFNIMYSQNTHPLQVRFDKYKK